MNRIDDFDGLARAWLEDGPTTMPDRALRVALDEVHLTPQRRAPWPARRTSTMRHPVWIAAAAAIVLGLVGLALVAGPARFGVGSSPTPSPTATPIPMPVGSLEAGRYQYPTDDAVVPFDIRLTVPAGWHHEDWGAIARDDGGALLVFWTVDGVFTDPCRWATTGIDPGVGIAGLVDALGRQAARDPGEPVDTTFAGHAARQIVSHRDATPDATCDGGAYVVYTLGDAQRGGLPLGSTSTYWAVDVNGQVLLVEATVLDGAPSAVRDELMAVAGSTEVAPLPRRSERRPAGPPTPTPISAPVS